MTSAAGTATEEAFQEGADYGKGMAYGAVSGAVEGATEKLMPGLGGLYGKGLVKTGKAALKEGAEQVAKTGLKRVLSEAAGEGVEEMISELAAPATKTIYKGRDALAEYGDADYWQGVGEAGIIGAGTSIAYGGSVGHITKTSGVYADAASVMEDIDAQTEALADLESKGKLTPEREIAAAKRIKADYEKLSEVLQRANPKARERILASPLLSAAFESDGALRASVATNLDARVQYAGEGSGGEMLSRGLWGNEQAVNEQLAANGTRIYEGELTEAEAENLSRLRKAHTALSRMGLIGTEFVIAEESSGFSAYLDGKTVVIGKDTLTDGTYLRKLVHEVEHFTEGTKEWAALADFVWGLKSTKAVIAEVVGTPGYGVTQADADGLEAALQSGKLTKGQRTLISEVVASQSEVLFGDEQTVMGLTRTNRTLAEKILDRIKAFLEVFTAKTPEERAVVRRMQRAKQLFEQALGKAGTKYAVREMQSAEKGDVVLDGEGAVGYNNDGEIKFARRKKVIPAPTFNFLHKNFPGENDSGSEAHRLAVWWASDKRVVSGDQTLISMNGRWYLVEKFDDAENKYQVEKFVSKAEYKQIWEDIKEYGRSGKVKSVQGSIDFIDSIDQPSNSTAGEQSSAISNATGYRDQNSGVLTLDQEQTEGREHSAGGRDRDNARISTDQQRRTTRVKRTIRGYYDNVAGERRKVYDYGEGRYQVENPRNDVKEYYDSPEAAIEAENESLIRGYARQYAMSPGEVKMQLEEDFELLSRAYDNGIQFSRKPTGDTIYTEAQYRDFGWVRDNDVLTSGAWKNFTAKFASALSSQTHPPKTKSGEFMIAVSDIDDPQTEGVENKIVYATGTIESPRVSRVLEIDLDDETSLDEQRRIIYALERRGVQPEIGELFHLHAATDSKYLRNGQRNRTQSGGHHDQLGADRGRGRAAADRIKEFKVNEDGSFTTVYADGRTEVQYSRKPTGAATKAEADVERLRVYTKKDAAEIIADVVGQYMVFESEGVYGQLVGKSQREAIEALWRGLNSAEPGMQGGVALDIAEYIINNATVASVWEQDTTEQTEEAKRRLTILRGLMHKLDLSGIKGEIAHRLDDKKGTAYLVWGARKGEQGLSLDGIAAELVKQGLPITAENPADIFFEIMDLHRKAVETLQGEGDMARMRHNP